MRNSCCKALLLFLPLLTGCLFHTRKIPQAKPPSAILSAKADELVDRINQQYDAMQSLTATVELQLSKSNMHKGEQRDYTPIRSNILMRKPAMLRLLAFVPVVHTKLFDLASNGKTFKLLIPPQNKAYEGLNTVHKKSTNQVENLRPAVFLDSMVIHRIEPEDLYTVTAMSKTAVGANRKTLLEIPEYELSVFQKKEIGNELTPVRVIRFHREDLLPYEQDIYDAQGNLETQVSYADYQDFGGTKFPGSITIVRPLESYQISMTVEKVIMNQPLGDEQFDLKIPEGIAIKTLE